MKDLTQGACERVAHKYQYNTYNTKHKKTSRTHCWQIPFFFLLTVFFGNTIAKTRTMANYLDWQLQSSRHKNYCGNDTLIDITDAPWFHEITKSHLHSDVMILCHSVAIVFVSLDVLHWSEIAHLQILFDRKHVDLDSFILRGVRACCVFHYGLGIDP